MLPFALEGKVKNRHSIREERHVCIEMMEEHSNSLTDAKPASYKFNIVEGYPHIPEGAVTVVARQVSLTVAR